MLRNRHRKTLLTSAALVAATTLLAACQDDGGSSEDDSKSDSSSSSGKDGSAKNSGDADGGQENGTGGGSEDAPDHGADPEGTSGTWFGTVSYVAPGKYSVSDMKGTKQAFMTSTDTKIVGVGEICAAGETCSESDLEAAAKKGVSAKVKLDEGTAVSVEEDGNGGPPDEGNASEGGVNGTWFGNVSYMAPGKYSVSDMKGKKQIFMTTTDTAIVGAGEICGQGETCSESDLEAAAKEGVSAKVKLKDGNAVSIKED